MNRIWFFLCVLCVLCGKRSQSTWKRSHQAIARSFHVVFGQTFQFPPEGGTAKGLEQYLHPGQLEMVSTDNQVVPFRDQGNEIQPKNPCCRSRAYAAIHFATEYLPRRRQVAESNTFIPLDVFAGNTYPVQERIQ